MMIFSSKIKYPSILYLKDKIQNKRENEFRIYVFKIFAWQTI